MKKLQYLGHSCFQLFDADHSLIFDPFLTGNPSATLTADEITSNYILVSHCHGDHIGDTVTIAKRTGATVISTAEVARSCEEQGCKIHSMHIGGKHAFDFGYVRVTVAFHGSGLPGGHACGFIVKFGGTTVYFAGDTGLFGDMALLGRLEKIDYALLPIGDNYTMGPDDALEAAAMLKPRFIIPMHYNTWPLLAQDPAAFKQAVETKLDIPVIVVNPGESLELK